VPKKLYVYAAEYVSHFKDSRGFGWKTPDIDFDWSVLRNNKTEEVLRLNGIYDSILEKANVEIIHGRGRFVDPHTVDVNGEKYTAKRVLIAVGGWPYIPDIVGKEYIVTSNEIFDLADFSKRLLIVGGGYIAVEFAGEFNGLGAEVTQIYRGELFLRGFDNEVRELMATEMEKKVLACALILMWNQYINKTMVH
jgi:glutathione reductase (NADPH)